MGTKRATAGKRGDDVRSDLWVDVEEREQGGLEIEVASKVAPYYGDRIRDQVTDLLRTLGVPHARVEIDDRGALPFAIAARVETAVRRLRLLVEGDARPERSAPSPPLSAPDRYRRSRLYLPGNEPKYFPNAGLYGPDAVILDLEDSVHVDEKDAARTLVRNALRTIDFRGAEKMVRINQLPLGHEDLQALLPEAPDLILVPKVETGQQLEELDAVISSCGDEDRSPWLMPILESALGIENAFEVARASPRIVALTIGLEDYAADLGVPKTARGLESSWARRRMVNAARAAGIQAIDSVFGQVDDLEGLQTWAAESRGLGFEGMGCVHPRQIPVIHAAFDPSAAEVAGASRIVEAFERAQAAGLGVVSLGSKMIDPPVLEQARRIVERARRLGLLDRDGSAGADR